MWHLYCLPGRVITEIGYLFPKPGQITASRRRRENGFAVFLFATMFWVLALPFLLPVAVGIAALLIHGVGTIMRLGRDPRSGRYARRRNSEGEHPITARKERARWA